MRAVLALRKSHGHLLYFHYPFMYPVRQTTTAAANHPATVTKYTTFIFIWDIPMDNYHGVLRQRYLTHVIHSSNKL